MLNTIVVDTIVVDDLIKSTSKSGFKGVSSNQGRYQAQCHTAPCHHNHLGRFNTPEEAAQAYLQHGQIQHGQIVQHGRTGNRWFKKGQLFEMPF
jgi:hypothetical protein